MPNSCNKSKAVIIGAGSVGATVAYTLAIKMLVSEIVLIDVNKDKAVGEAMDLRHGLSYYEDMNIYAGEYEDCEGADYIIITAGAKQKPGETRIQLTDTNKNILNSIMQECLKYNKEAFYILISNPVDILTYNALKLSGLPKNQIFGTGTALDTSRLKYLLSKELGVSSSNIHAYIIGEHGDSSLPVYSHANIAGIPIKDFEGCTDEVLEACFEKAKNAAYEVIKRKGATFYAIALVVSEFIQIMQYDQKTIMPVSTMLEGEYGLTDICLGVPSIIGAKGVEKVIDLKLNDLEAKQLQDCANNIRQYL